MKFTTILKFLLVFILPFLIFIQTSSFVGFDNKFYQQKFSEYSVNKDLPQATSLHEKVINFIKSKNNELPNEFNEKEKQHLLDVRNLIKSLTIIFYVLIILFVLLLIISILKIKKKIQIKKFIGEVLVFGGFLTVILASALFFFIILDFSSTFESFHKLFFIKETYIFDPAKDTIVNLYPAQLFMEIGIRMAKWIVISSIVIILVGILLKLKKPKIVYDK